MQVERDGIVLTGCGVYRLFSTAPLFKSRLVDDLYDDVACRFLKDNVSIDADACNLAVRGIRGGEVELERITARKVLAVIVIALVSLVLRQFTA